ncbi:sugar transferase [Clostridium perfringens]|uniref:Glycosyl transferase n=2 Tax=Clostridium perfringens TaxID=1502 RepID=A0A127EFG8_CLOPF|nr:MULTISPECIES: sugar transferase [Clostridium]AMN34688.1 glycosyl transferase [Clostridium perfringens]MDK7590342.1 sugar transferase [Clostridium sp. UMB9555B]MDK7628611.1 sugar transferase [Clostridium sp. UMB9555A]
MLKCWDDLPKNMQTEAVRPYYDILKKRKISLLFKRVFDIIVSIIMLVILSPIIIILSIAIVLDSKGGVFFRQERITQYGRKFYIHKFRTMVANAENLGSQVTVANDMRVTKIGAKIRKYRLDELPQLIDILQGNMSFVGTRPEVTKYVERYTPEMLATLLLPAGVTSEASIKYKDEERLLQNADNADEVYINEVLPEKMEYNLRSLYEFNFFSELGIMIKTVLAVIK